MVTGGPWTCPEAVCAWGGGRQWTGALREAGMGGPVVVSYPSPTVSLLCAVSRDVSHSTDDSPVKRLQVIKHEITLSHLVRKFFPFQFSMNPCDFFKGKASGWC